jgi:oligoendopeptidase F
MDNNKPQTMNDKERFDHATKLLKKRITELKKLEEETKKPLNSKELLNSLKNFENEFMGTSLFSKFQVFYTQIEKKLSSYDTPINQHTKQISKLIENNEEILNLSKLVITTAKAVGWILGVIITLATLLVLIKGAFS